jgi:ribose transport system substrate-binding protein
MNPMIEFRNFRRLSSRLTASGVAAVLLLISIGCGSSTSGDSSKAKHQIRIGFAMTLDHPYWQNMRLAAIEEAKKEGAEITITNAEEDAVKQINQINSLISNSVDIVCLVPMKEEPLVQGVAMLNRAKIPVIIVNREIGEGADYVCYVVSDTYQGSATAARILMKAIGGKGKIVEFHQEVGTGVEIDASRALRDVLKEFPDVEIVARVPQKNSRELVVSTMETLLQQHPEINGVYAHDDVFAIAAGEVCRKNGRGDIALAGYGGGKEAFQAIREGTITGSAMQSPGAEGRLAVQTAMRYLRGETLEKRYPTSSPALTKDTVDKYTPEW